jgi:hypothetical protein
MYVCYPLDSDPLPDSPNNDESLGSLARSPEEDIDDAARARLESACRLISSKQGWTSPGDLKVWLQHGASCGASDPRDKVFAFLGLAAKGYNIEPDYSTSTHMAKLCIYITKKSSNTRRVPTSYIVFQGAVSRVTVCDHLGFPTGLQRVLLDNLSFFFRL